MYTVAFDKISKEHLSSILELGVKFIYFIHCQLFKCLCCDAIICKGMK